MLQRARSGVPLAALVLLAVPIHFGLIDSATGVLVGPAFSGLMVVVGAALSALVEAVHRRFDHLERRLAEQQKRQHADVVERRRPLVPDFEIEALRLGKGAALRTWT